MKTLEAPRKPSFPEEKFSKNLHYAFCFLLQHWAKLMLSIQQNEYGSNGRTFCIYIFVAEISSVQSNK